MVKPQSIKISSIAFIISFIISLASLSIGLVTIPEMRSGPVIIFFLAFLTFLFFILYKINNSKNWARIVLTIFSVYGVYAQLFDPNPQNIDIPMLINVFNYIGVVTITIGLIYLYIPSSNIWFKAKV